MGVFRFKHFDVDDCGCGMKVGTDSVLLGAWVDCADARTVVDAGAGSGLLSLMVAQRAPQAHILGVEADEGAYAASVANFAASPWSSRIQAIHSDVLDWCPDTPVDLVIGNPPYFNNEMVSPEAARAAARHANGCFGPLTLIDLAGRILADGGSLAMVTPTDDADEIMFRAALRHLDLWRRCDVRTVRRKAPKRVMWQFCRSADVPGDAKPPLSPQYAELTIRDENGFSTDYVRLTEEFYLYLH